MEQISKTEDMKSMVTCTNKLVQDGFKENFKVSEQGLMALEKERIYKPEEVSIVNFYRFEGYSDPGDNTILYAIITNDGLKGTLTDGYGAYGDAQVENFIKQVEEIHKKTKIKPEEDEPETIGNP
jgi:hypothetical protein